MPGVPVGGLGQARAVEPARAASSPQVGGAELSGGERECIDHRARHGGFVGDGQGQGQHGVHVGVGVVVPVDGGAQRGCGPTPVGAEQGRGAVDRVDRIVRGRGPCPTGPDGGERGERGRLELHGALGPGGVGPGPHARVPSSGRSRSRRCRLRRAPTTGGPDRWWRPAGRGRARPAAPPRRAGHRRIPGPPVAAPEAIGFDRRSRPPRPPRGPGPPRRPGQGRRRPRDHLSHSRTSVPSVRSG